MNRIYQLEVMDGILYGEDKDSNILPLGIPVYYNSYTGLLYTESGSYIVLSFAKGEEYQTNEFIRQCLDQIWTYANV